MGLRVWKGDLVVEHLSGMCKNRWGLGEVGGVVFIPQEHSVAVHCLLNTGLGLWREKKTAPVIQLPRGTTVFRSSWEKTILSSPFRQGKLQDPQTLAALLTVSKPEERAGSH